MNGFTGLSTNQIISFFITGAVFTAYAALVAISLAAFRITSRPRHGRVRTAAVWHIAALCLFMVATISTVWGAPAEKTFVDDHDVLLSLGSARFDNVLIGVGFAAAGVISLLVGLVIGARQKRAWREAAIG